MTSRQPVPFTPEALQRAEHHGRVYGGLLAQEALRIAQAHRAGAISPAYVERAAAHIAHTIGRRDLDTALLVMALFGGAGLGGLASLAIDGTWKTAGIVVTAAFLVVAAVAGAFAAGRAHT